MPDISVPIEDSVFLAAVTKAMYEALDEQARMHLLDEAIKNMVKPTTWGKESLLQMAFNQALATVAREQVQKWITDNAVIRDKVNQFIGEAMRKIIDGDYEIEFAAVDALSKVLLSKRDY